MGTKREPISWWARAGAIGVVAVAAAGVADVFVAPTGAQESPVAEPVSVTDAGDPYGASGDPDDPPPANTHPAISDDAGVVAFVSEIDMVTIGDEAVLVEPGTTQVVVRDRAAGSTRPVEIPDPRLSSNHPAISGNGCVVALTVEVPAPDDASEPAMVELHAVDRCADAADPSGPTDLIASVEAEQAFGTPAVSADGSFIVWSTGTSVVRYARGADGAYGPGTTLFGPDDGVTSTGPDVDVSDDGKVAVFTSGPGAAYQPTPSNVYRWTAGDPPAVDLVSATAADPPEGDADSTAPVLSGDGAIVLYESVETDLLAAAGESLVGPSFVVVDHANGTNVLADAATGPALSPDGHHAVYDRGGALRAAWWADGDPFAAVTEETLSGGDGAVGGSATGAAVSAHGRTVVFDSINGAALTDDSRFADGTHVWSLLRTEEVGGDPVDLGSIQVPGVLTGTASIVNSGVTSVPIESLTVDAPYTLAGTTCAGVLQPGTTCTADVSINFSTDAQVDGFVRLVGGIPTDEFTVALTATGTPAPTTTTAVPTTTTSTTVATTIPSRPPSTRPPTPRPPTTRPPTTRPPTATTTTTTTVALPVVFQPATFEFAPTIVDAGRRAAALEIFNPSPAAVTVLDVTVEQAEGSGFSADGSACSQPVPVGDTCTVGLDFRPGLEGSLTATVVASLSDGSRATATVTGFGAPPPVLIVTPDVASNGQVVAIVGAGFPAATSLDLSWDRRRIVLTPTTDEVGGFAETLLVLENTPGGPTEVVVAGQVDLFGDVVAELLVSESGSRSNAAFLGELGQSVLR